MLFNRLGAGLDDHAVGRSGGAGRHRFADTLDLNDAEATGAEGLEALVVAKGRHLFAVAVGDFVNGLALGEFHKLAVEGEGAEFLFNKV